MAKLTEVFLFEAYNQQALYNVFPPDAASFIKAVEDELNKDYGPGWKQEIDQVHGWQGAADWLLKQFEQKFWTAYEAYGEASVYIDEAQQVIQGAASGLYYPHMTLVSGRNNIDSRWDLIPQRSDYFLRNKRPLGVNDFKDPNFHDMSSSGMSGTPTQRNYDDVEDL